MVTSLSQNPEFDAALDRQTQAQNTSRSVWVAASAGAGKTRVLTSRILRLLLEGANPSSILALTYTRAAAKEMTTRVIDMARDLALANDQVRMSLLQGLLGLGDGQMIDSAIRDRSAGLYERILDTPGGLAIQTIHSFCQSLLGRFPFEAGLTPGFEPIEDAERQQILETACGHVMAKKSGAFRHLKSTVRPDALITLAQAMVRIDWETFPAKQRLAAFDQRMGGGFAHSEYADLQYAFTQEIKQRSEDILALASQASQTGKPTDIALATALQRALGRGNAMGVLSVHFLTDGRLKRRGVHTKTLETDPTLNWLLTVIPTRWARMQSQRLYDLNADLMMFGSAISKEFSHAKARRAVLDFDDLVKTALKLVSTAGGPTYVQYRLDQQLEHILLDEAQDTSVEQWQVIAGLAEAFFDDASQMDDRRRTLFVVGDFKQSIYSFQGALPKLFDGWRERFQSLAGDALVSVDMVHSFRSSPHILSFVDLIAAQLGQSELRAGGQENTFQHRAVQSARPGLIQIWPALEEAALSFETGWKPPASAAMQGSRRARLGRSIARHIYRLCFDAQWAQRAEAYLSSGRRIVPGDFLILVQNRRADFANALIGELKALHVPVTGVDRFHLRQELVVQDLLALGEICLQPSDDLALAALLKSPLFGLNEGQLFQLAHDRGQTTLMERLRNQMPEIAEELTFLASRVGHVSVYDFYADYLFAQGARKQILAHAGPEVDEVLSVFLDRARLHDRFFNGDMVRFIEGERGSDQDLKRDTSEAAGRVRLMTVHGAKGLEAPIVILPDLRSSTGTGSRVASQVTSLPDVGPIWVPNKSFDCPVTVQAKADREGEEEAERERLLYVALTRAEERLVICTDQVQKNRPGKGKESWYDRALLVAREHGECKDLELKELGWSESQGYVYGTYPDLPQTGPFVSSDDILSMQPTWLAQPIIKPKEKIGLAVSPSQLNHDLLPSLSPTSRAHALARGTLIHAALEHLPNQNPGLWPHRLTEFFADRAPEVPWETRAQWCEEVLVALKDKDLSLFFGPGSRAELGVVGQIQDEEVVGRIDRIHIDSEAKIIRILDYKTNRPPPGQADQVAPAYIYQLRMYWDLVQPLYPDYEIRTYLFWTHTAAFMDMTELCAGVR